MSHQSEATEPRADPRRTVLELSNVSTTFPTKRGIVHAVDGVTFDLADRDVIGIVGESGSGKSMLCKTVMSLLPRTAIVGDDTVIRYQGKPIKEMDKRALRHFWGVEMAMVFQDPMTSLNPVMKVGRQLAGPIEFHLGSDRKVARARALELLEQVGVPDPRRRIDQYPHELSGGMRQRVTIARALACRPKVLIADEPTTALDVTVQRQILDLLQSLQEQQSMSTLLVTHDLGVVAGRTKWVVVMYGGQVVERARTNQLFRKPRHPYTVALLDSIPRMTGPRHERLHAISGRPPVVIGAAVGCRFAPRCRYAQERCLRESPELATEVTDDREVRCFFPVGTPASDEALEHNLRVGVTAAGLSMSEPAVEQLS